MKIRQSIFLLTALMMIALLVGCSSSGTKTTPPPPPVLSVAFSPAAPASVVVNSQTPLTAVVQNDSANAGVNWTVSCTAGPSARPGTTIPPCGSLSATSTASGTANTYTAPPAVPASAVTITATSVTDGTKSAVANITIATAVASPLADGNYVFSVQGTDAATGAPYAVAGVFTISGGAITGGEQDFVDFASVLALDVFNPATSSVTITADGNLQIVLDTQDTSVGVGGVETFSGTLTCTCKAQITEFDGSAAGNGTLDLQTSTAVQAGGYAFGLAGVDFNEFPLALGGVLNVDTLNNDGSASISGTNSVFDANDDFSGSTFQGETFGASTISTPDSSGRVTITLNPTDTVDFPQIILVGYVIDATRIRLVESNDSFTGTTGGTALGQGVNTGTFTSIAGSSYAAGLTGFDSFFIQQAAGVFTANGDGSVSGNISYNDLVNISAGASHIVAGSYTLDPTGRVTVTGVTDGNIAPVDLQLYLTGDGHAIVISMDNTDTLAGLGYAQAPTAAPFSGTYVLNAGGADANLLGPISAVGPLTSDGTSALAAPSSTGIDLNWLDFTNGFVTFTDLAVSGTFTTPDATGTSGGTITGLDVTTTNADVFTYYIGDTDATSGNANTVVMIETDPNQLTLGFFSLELE